MTREQAKKGMQTELVMLSILNTEHEIVRARIKYLEGLMADNKTNYYSNLLRSDEIALANIRKQVGEKEKFILKYIDWVEAD